MCILPPATSALRCSAVWPLCLQSALGVLVNSSWPGKWKIGEAELHHMAPGRAWGWCTRESCTAKMVVDLGLNSRGPFMNLPGGREEETEAIKTSPSVTESFLGVGGVTGTIAT